MTTTPTISASSTIAAIATPAGRGGVGIIRISGPLAGFIAKNIMGIIPKPRTAVYSNFKDHTHKLIDQGIGLYFPRPHSFTGEDVLELQGHGGPCVLDMLLQSVIHLGARLALPGEFSQRAFLNDKIDLVQAEAIADLIDASSQQAARSALRSLQGDFSKKIHHLRDQLIKLRMFIEAAIDFPEDEIDFIGESTVKNDLADLIEQINQLKQSAQQGILLQEGMTVVLVGKPNAGKSSLLNCLSGHNSAIVTEIAGTTRDVLREHINIDGLPLHIIDTAGLHDSNNIIEQEGMRRTREMIQQADLVLLIVDARESEQQNFTHLRQDWLVDIPAHIPCVIIRNKIDLINQPPQQILIQGYDVIALSAKYQQGIELLMQYLKQKVGYQQQSEGIFMARRRHLVAIEKTQQHLIMGQQQLNQYFAAELLAEELTQAQHSLGEVTGEFSADDLLGKIFSTFCIGK